MSNTAQDQFIEDEKSLPPLIYIIDDDENFLSIAHHNLKKEFRVKIFKDALDGINEAENNCPDLMLIDRSMPNMDGYEVVKQLKGHPITCNVPVIFISSSNNPEDRVRMEKLGAVGFLMKPFSIDSAAKSIWKFLDGLNQKIESSCGKIRASIVNDEGIKYELIEKKILEHLDNGEKVIFLSWRSGDSFGERVQKYINEEKLLFFEIRSSLITKFPFLQDITPIFEDIESLSTFELEKSILVFDDPRNLYDYNNKERALSKTMALSKIIQVTFKETDIYLTRFTDPSMKLFLLKITKIFSGQMT